MFRKTFNCSKKEKDHAEPTTCQFSLWLETTEWRPEMFRMLSWRLLFLVNMGWILFFLTTFGTHHTTSFARSWKYFLLHFTTQPWGSFGTCFTGFHSVWIHGMDSFLAGSPPALWSAGFVIRCSHPLFPATLHLQMFQNRARNSPIVLCLQLLILWLGGGLGLATWDVAE